MFDSDRTGNFNADVWGPHFWFFIHTLAHSYPPKPNEVTKRKYYDFISNLPLFIPNEKIGNRFAKLLDLYPVSPYLDKKESFVRWTHFIHNKINVYLGKEEIGLEEATKSYFAQYNPHSSLFWNETFAKKHAVYIYFAFILGLGISVVYFANDA